MSKGQEEPLVRPNWMIDMSTESVEIDGGPAGNGKYRRAVPEHPFRWQAGDRPGAVGGLLSKIRGGGRGCQAFVWLTKGRPRGRGIPKIGTDAPVPHTAFPGVGVCARMSASEPWTSSHLWREPGEPGHLPWRASKNRGN